MRLFKAKLLPTAPLKLVTPLVVLSTIKFRGVVFESLSTVFSKVMFFPVKVAGPVNVTASP